MSDARARRRHPKRHQGRDQVALAWLHPGDVAGAFMDSVLGLVLADVKRLEQGERPRIVTTGSGYIAIESGPRLAASRDSMVRLFLTHPAYVEAKWLLILDSDMVFGDDLLDRMLEVAERETVPVLGALCFAGGRSGRNDRMYPTIYRLEHDEELDRARVAPQLDYPRDALVKVGATGAACLLVHRDVFLRMAEPYPLAYGTYPNGRPNPQPWFTEGIDAGRSFGEDIAFCMRLNAMKIPIHVHTGIQVGHLKRTILDEASYDAWLSTQPAREGGDDAGRNARGASEAVADA